MLVVSLNPKPQTLNLWRSSVKQPKALVVEGHEALFPWAGGGLQGTGAPALSGHVTGAESVPLDSGKPPSETQRGLKAQTLYSPL